jgi:Bacterial transglutaminase-like N-terminal region
VLSFDHSQRAAYDIYRYSRPVRLGDHRLMLRPRTAMIFGSFKPI